MTEQTAEQVEGKKYYESKTFWTNVVAALTIVAQMKYGFVVTPELQAMLLSFVNLGLRSITKEKIVW